MYLTQKVNFHNRFDVEVWDSISGRLKSTAVAHNILLDQMYVRLCGGNDFFNHIHFGTGTATPVPSRTSLNAFLGARPAITEEVIKAFPVSSCKKKITLLPSEYVGSKITEVGVAYGTTSTTLVTHALLKDSEGNLLAIDKSATDTIIIYATIFVTLSNDYNFILLDLPNGNSLLNYLISGAAAPVGAFKLQQALYEQREYALATTANAVWTSDVANKRRRTDIKRFDIYDGNGNVQAMEFSNLFRIGFPHPMVHPGQPYSGVMLGTGDGTKKSFKIPSDNVLEDSIVVRINNNLTTDYVIIEQPGSTLIPSFLPPALAAQGNSASLNADGTVLAISSANVSPHIKVYDWIESNWVARPTPPALASKGNSASLNADGTVLAISSDSYSPYVKVYTQNFATSFSVIFNTPPAVNDVITVDYTVGGVHKSVNSVIDVSFAIQYGEGV